MADAPTLSGIHHVKFPVRDLAKSRAWYERVLGLEVQMEFADDHDGVVRGVAGPAGGVPIALREDPLAAEASPGSIRWRSRLRIAPRSTRGSSGSTSSA